MGKAASGAVAPKAQRAAPSKRARISTDSNASGSSNNTGASLSAVSAELDVEPAAKRRRKLIAGVDAGAGSGDEVAGNGNALRDAEEEESATANDKAKGGAVDDVLAIPQPADQPGAKKKGKNKNTAASERRKQQGLEPLKALLNGDVPTGQRRAGVSLQLNALHVTAMFEQNKRLSGTLDMMQKLMDNSVQLLALCRGAEGDSA